MSANRYRIFYRIVLALTFLAFPKAGFTALASCDGPTDEKVALVIGNGYSGVDAISGLEDANAITEHLCQMRFSVLTLLDGDTKAITDSLDELRTRIAAAKTVVFFYSGHGYQINGSNYLLPINTAIDPSGPQVSLDTVFRSLSGAPDDAVKLVLLDACRTNVNLKVSGGTTLEGLPGWSPGLGKPSSKAPPRTLFGFAASYGKTAISGIPGSVSPYTSALLRSIREPGLEIRPLLRRIRDDVFVGTRRRQAPQDEGLAKIPEPFYLREPVEVPAVIAGWPHSNLLVILNGEMVLDSNQNPHDRLRLKAGENELLLLVSNGKTFNKGHNWERPEGWSYRLELNLPDGRKEVFEDREKVPFKDGPHHGKVFPVARARIIVDDATAETTLPSEFREDKLWKTAVPLWAQDQERLYERSVKDLPLDDILDPTAMPNFGIVPAPAVLALLREILTSGRFLGQGVAVPELTFFVVWGNKEYKPLVTACIEPKMKDRVNDLRASMAAALKRHPRPFDSFDQALNDCIREAATTGDSTFPIDDLKVWTVIEDRSEGRLPVPIVAVPETLNRTDVAEGSGGFHD